MTTQNTYFETITDRLEACETHDQLGLEISDFLCQTLSTVLLDGAVKVTDLAGKIASTKNNYLMSEDGKQFAGLVTIATGEVTEFTIFERKNGSWAKFLSIGVSLPRH